MFVMDCPSLWPSWRRANIEIGASDSAAEGWTNGQRLRGALTELERASLVERCAVDRYRIHPLARVYAAELADTFVAEGHEIGNRYSRPDRRWW